MALPATMLLAPHFTAAELGADLSGVSATDAQHLRAVALWLEAARDVLKVPLRVDSGFRTPEHNAAVGGVSDSDHLTGYAADFVPVGVTQFDAWRALKPGIVPPFDQLIYYPVEGHIHVSVNPRMRGQVLLKVAEGSYAALTDELASRLRGFV